MNHYGEQESNINRGKTKAEYPWYSKRESWEHVMQCKEVMAKRIQFVVQMHKELKENQLENISNEELRAFINNI